jgi:hypothetical protein
MLAVLGVTAPKAVDAEKVLDPLANLGVSAIHLLVRVSEAREGLPFAQRRVGLVEELRHGWQQAERV